MEKVRDRGELASLLGHPLFTKLVTPADASDRSDLRTDALRHRVQRLERHDVDLDDLIRVLGRAETLRYGVRGLALWAPRKPVDAAINYAQDHANAICETLEDRSAIASSPVSTTAVDLQLKAVNVRVAALLDPDANPDAIEAANAGMRTADEYETTVGSALAEARRGIKGVRRRLFWTRWLPSVVRVVALAVVAIAVWGIAELIGDVPEVAKFAVALAVFIVVDQTLVDRFIEPRLDHLRWRRTLTNIESIFDDLCTAAIAVAITDAPKQARDAEHPATSVSEPA